jgi:uncharacterized protein (DUF1778 family)
MPAPATEKETTEKKRTKVQKTERLEVRMTKEQKELLMRATEIEGRTVTDFVVDCAQEKAHRILREHESMILSERDRRAFVEALLNDTEPNARLKHAAERYSERW